jgi:hypothetical protein
MIDVTVDDGKYRIIQEDGRLRFERHGEPWIDNAALLPGSKMIIAMACEIEELRKLRDHCKTFVTEREIACAQDVYQGDGVLAEALTFIKGVCEIVGYMKIEEDE